MGWILYLLSIQAYLLALNNQRGIPFHSQLVCCLEKSLFLQMPSSGNLAPFWKCFFVLKNSRPLRLVEGEEEGFLCVD